MANFSLVALRVLPNNQPSIQKVLKEGWFLFNQSYRIEKEKDGNEKLVVNKNNYPLQDDFFGANISISAIVGKNGSGKSSVLEFMFRMINNFSFWFVKKQRRNAAEHFYFIEGVYGDLHFVINEQLGILHCRGNFVGITIDKYKIGANFDNNQSILSEFQSYEIKNEILVKEFIDIAKNFFYTIVTNYSLQAFLATDYNKEDCGNFDANGQIGYDSSAIWINSLFHKNDGYSAPIVLNPYRDDGVIDLSKEYQLTKQRLTAILIESKKSKKQFIDDYQLNSIDYTYEPTNVLQKFSKHYKSQYDLHRDFISAWDHNNDNTETYTSVILNQFGYKFLSNINNLSPQQIDAYIYLVYKTLNIAKKYPSYSDYAELVREENHTNEKRPTIFMQLVLSNHKQLLKDLVRDILKDKSHITLKITQTRFFLDKCNIQQLSNFQKGEFDFTYNDYISTLSLKKELNGLYEIMEFLPPPFFDYEIKLDKMVKGKVIDNPVLFQTMSSGEKQFLYSVSTLIYHIKNLRSIQQSHRVKYRHINLVLDEVELCFHPEYQRLFINKLIETIKRLHLNNRCSFNIIFATHSPFILSDIPSCNIMYLEEGEQVNHKISIDTFGANINDILKQSFFLENGFIGEFAKKKINELLDTIEKKDETKKDYVQNCINLIGEPLIKEQLQSFFNEKFGIEDDKDRKIKELEMKIKQIEEQK